MFLSKNQSNPRRGLQRPILAAAILAAFLSVSLAACSSPAGPAFTPTSPPTTSPSLSLPTPTAFLPDPMATEPTAAEPAAATPAEPPAVEASPTPEPTSAPLPPRVSSLPDPGGYAWELALQGSQYPVFVTGAGDQSGDLYILQQSGQIRIARQGQLLETPFLEISDRTSGATRPGYYGERGLLGLAFHPLYSQNGFLYVNYTDREGNTVIARFQRSSANPDLADPGSELRLLQVTQPFPNHNGGMLAFGPDGYLYIGLGDGGSGGDPQDNGQSTNTLLGKILRIDVNQGELYAVPADNPYTAGGGLSEIWALGLRNPWRFSFDRLTGDLFIADVGQNQWEEINFLPAGSSGGANLGWRYRESLHEFQGQPPAGLSLLDPVAEYGHGPGCSVTGGVVARSANLPAWEGVYLYGDYCSGQVWGLLQSPDGAWQNQLLFETGMNITSFGSDDAGEVYLLDYSGGDIYRLAQK